MRRLHHRWPGDILAERVVFRTRHNPAPAVTCAVSSVGRESDQHRGPCRLRAKRHTPVRRSALTHTDLSGHALEFDRQSVRPLGSTTRAILQDRANRSKAPAREALRVGPIAPVNHYRLPVKNEVGTILGHPAERDLKSKANDRTVSALTASVRCKLRSGEVEPFRAQHVALLVHRRNPPAPSAYDRVAHGKHGAGARARTNTPLPKGRGWARLETCWRPRGQHDTLLRTDTLGATDTGSRTDALTVSDARRHGEAYHDARQT